MQEVDIDEVIKAYQKQLDQYHRLSDADKALAKLGGYNPEQTQRYIDALYRMHYGN